MYNPFKKVYKADELEVFRFLSKCTLFTDLDNAELSYFLPFLYKRDYAHNEAVYFRNDPSQALYIIQTGVVSINLYMKEKTEFLSTKRSFAYLGETALISGAKRYSNAVVSSETAEIYVIPQANLLEVFERKPSIKATMFANLAREQGAFINTMFKAYHNQDGFFDLAQAFKKSSETSQIG